MRWEATVLHLKKGVRFRDGGQRGRDSKQEFPEGGTTAGIKKEEQTRASLVSLNVLSIKSQTKDVL